MALQVESHWVCKDRGSSTPVPTYRVREKLHEAVYLPPTLFLSRVSPALAWWHPGPRASTDMPAWAAVALDWRMGVAVAEDVKADKDEGPQLLAHASPQQSSASYPGDVVLGSVRRVGKDAGEVGAAQGGAQLLQHQGLLQLGVRAALRPAGGGGWGVVSEPSAGEAALPP